MQMNKTYKWLILLMALAFPASVLTSLFVGSFYLDPKDVVQCLLFECPNKTVETIVWDLRLPRVLMAILAGAGLAMSGAILQTCTRNPLADPYLFGIVSGAGLGATVATLLLPESLLVSLPLFAFVGAIFSVVLVLALSQYLMRIDLLLLGGVAIGFMLSSITQFLLYINEPFATNRIIFWLMGSLANSELSQGIWLLSILVVCFGISIIMSRQMDAMMLDDESAGALGVNVKKIRLGMLLLCALLTAIIVSWCGGIGFVGLMIPHIVRAFGAVSSKALITGSVLLGGFFLLWVDFLARQTLAGQEIPIGIITAAFGSVFFIAITIKTSVQKG